MQCQKPFKNEDIIVINPPEEDLVTMITNMETRRSAVKAKNKGLKREAGEGDKKAEKGKKLKTIQNNSASIAQKLVKLEDPAMAKTKASYSVAKDPNASDVFKSLFTTHDKAVNQTKGHWVTYNPFYN